MGLFSSLFGSSGSDKADKMRQQAIDAFSSIQTPALKDLQVQLQQYVNTGKLTPEQAETSLLSSNAFNDIVTDPSYVGAQKQALQQLQQIGTQGGLTAVDKARMQDITNQQNQQANSRNASILQNAQERGVGGSPLTAVNQLLNEQGAADRASQQGTDVAAQAQTRALQAMQAAGQQGGALEGQQYGEQANKAQAQDAIDLFNKQTMNQTNLYNTQANNAAQAANLANAQAVDNANTATGNANQEYNAQQVQQQYNDALQKAQGVAGIYNNWANDATKQAQTEKGADMGLTAGLLQGGATALGGAFGGPMGAVAANSAAGSFNPKTQSTNPYDNTEPSFAEGGQVPTAKDIQDFKTWMAQQQQNGVKTLPEQVDAQNGSQNSPEDLAAMQQDQQSLTPAQLAILQGEALQNTPDHPENPQHLAMGGHVHCYAYGGEAHHHPDCYMAHGGFLKDLKKGALHEDLSVSSDKKIPSGKLEKATHSNNETLRKRAQFAENAKHWNHKAEGGTVEASTDTVHVSPEPKKEAKKEKGPIDKIADLIGIHADTAKQYDFKEGGHVPGHAKVAGDSPKNDTVDAKLSPGEVVVPRSATKDDEEFDRFMEKFRPSNQHKMAKGGMVHPMIPRVNETNPMRNTVQAPLTNAVPLAATNDANSFPHMMAQLKPTHKEAPAPHVPLEAKALANLHMRIKNLEGGK